jgi:hypothetical protein
MHARRRARPPRCTLLLASLLFVACEGCRSGSASTLTNPGVPSATPTGPVMVRTYAQDAAGDGVWFGYSAGLVYTADTNTMVDGRDTPSADVHLGAGDVVLIAGDIYPDDYHINAHSLSIEHVVDGPIEALDPAHAQLTVLGQKIFIHPATVFGASGSLQQGAVDLSGLGAGTRVLVSGDALESGEMLASRITPSDGTGDFLLSTYVLWVDPAAQRLQLGGLFADYGAATLSGFRPGGPAVGDRVRIRGSRASAAEPLRVTMLARLDSQLSGDAGTLVELHGLQQRSATAGRLEVAGYELAVQELPDCGGPAGKADLAYVTGSLAPGGEVTVHDSCRDTEWGDLEVAGPVVAVDADFGTLTVLGFQLQPALNARVSDVNTAAAALAQAGDFVDAYGFPGLVAGGQLVTTMVVTPVAAGSGVQVISASAQWFTYAAPRVSVAGVPLLITDSTTYVGFPHNMDKATFFAESSSFDDPKYFKPLGPYAWCGASLRFEVSTSLIGALTATRVTIRADWC